MHKRILVCFFYASQCRCQLFLRELFIRVYLMKSIGCQLHSVMVLLITSLVWNASKLFCIRYYNFTNFYNQHLMFLLSPHDCQHYYEKRKIIASLA